MHTVDICVPDSEDASPGLYLLNSLKYLLLGHYSTVYTDQYVCIARIQSRHITPSMLALSRDQQLKKSRGRMPSAIFDLLIKALSCQSRCLI